MSRKSSNTAQQTSNAIDDEDLFGDQLDDLIGDIDSLTGSGAITTNDDDLLLEMQELLS